MANRKSKDYSRRSFLSTGMMIGASTAGFLSLEEKHLLAALGPEENVKPKEPKTNTEPFPSGKIGKYSISRLISGGNLLSGWCHQRDLLFVSQLAQAYLTREKQFTTLQMMEENGINSISIDMVQLDIVKAYQNEWGGEIQTIVCVREDWGGWEKGNWDDLKVSIDQTIDKGANILFLHGAYCDCLVKSGDQKNLEVISKAIEYIRKQGYPAGLGSHAIEVPMECDTFGIEPDFYFKTFHHDQYWSAHPRENREKFSVDGAKSLDHNKFHDNIFDLYADKTREFMQKKKQPWIAFKVLAAGAIHPSTGFKFAFENGADFVTAGMFDFNVTEDVLTARKTLAMEEVKNRQRPWCG